MDTAALVRRRPDERMYAVVLTPRQAVQTRDDVSQFLSSVRALFREWEQRHGLGAVWWVAEVVEKPTWDRTFIPCPTRLYQPPDDQAERWPEGVRAEVAEVRDECQAGKRCPMCGGRGTLPGVHLHVHAAVMARPFWYGRGEAPEPPPGVDRWQDFGGRGFTGLVESHGLGVARVEVLRSKGGLAAYVSKACMMYLSKSAGTAGRREVDWDASQRGAQLAAAVYGRSRHREKGGRAYGLNVRERDAAVRVAFDPAPVGGAAAVAPASAARRSALAGQREHERQVQAVEAAACVESGGPSARVRLLGIGRRNAARGDYGRAAQAAAIAERGDYEVLRGTEVAQGAAGPGAERAEVPFPGSGTDGETVEPSQPEVLVWTPDDESGERWTAQPAGQVEAVALVDGWSGVPLVRADDWWTVQVADGLVVGRGAVLSFAEGLTLDDAPALLLLAQWSVQAAAAECEPGDDWPLGVPLSWCEVVRECGDAPREE